MMPDPGEAAAEADREWGRYLTKQPPPYPQPSSGEAVHQLTGMLEEIGFAPQAVPDGTRYRLLLRQCPFREIAENHQDVVCPLHLGLMQRALAEMRAPVTTGRLEPFADPSLSIAYLSAGKGSRWPRSAVVGTGQPASSWPNEAARPGRPPLPSGNASLGAYRRSLLPR